MPLFCKILARVQVPTGVDKVQKASKKRGKNGVKIEEKMNIDAQLLSILRCPESGLALAPASKDTLEKVNQKIQNGELLAQDGKKIAEPLLFGLEREDKKVLYPVRNDIPVLLSGEAISIESLF